MKNETKLRKELKKFTFEQINRANTFEQMIQNTNQNIADKVMAEGMDGKFGEANPINDFGFSIFYRFFVNFFLFFTAYESIFQLTLPEDSMFKGPFLFFNSLQGFGPNDDFAPAFAVPALIFLIEVLYQWLDEPNYQYEKGENGQDGKIK